MCINVQECGFLCVIPGVIEMHRNVHSSMSSPSRLVCVPRIGPRAYVFLIKIQILRTNIKHDYHPKLIPK